MSAPSDLYQAIILDHAGNPRNAALPADAGHRARRDNPLCGDRIELGLTMAGDTIAAAGFRGHGCAICMASASIMTEAIQGRTAAQALALARAVHALVNGGTVTLADHPDVAALGGVAAFPMRIECATLAWQALADALAGADSDADSDADSEPDTEPDTEPEPDTDSEPDAGADTEPEQLA